MLIYVMGVPLNGWAALNLTVQFLLPLLVGLVTTKETNRERQFVLLAGLTLLATVGAQVLQVHESGGVITSVNIIQIIVSAAINFVISLLSHYKVWKPNNISALMLALFDHKARIVPPVDPSPLTPSPNPNIKDLPARHLYVAGSVPEEEKAPGDGNLRRARRSA